MVFKQRCARVLDLGELEIPHRVIGGIYVLQVCITRSPNCCVRRESRVYSSIRTSLSVCRFGL